MKILFLNPPIQHAVRFPGPNSTWVQHPLAPPLGLMAISAFIKRYGYADVELLNGQTPNGLPDAQIVQALTRSSPAVVGITTTTVLYYNVIRLCRLVRACLPQAVIVLGGPHLTCYAREAVDRPEVDFAVVGEGEYTFLELLRALDGQGHPREVAGLAWKGEDGQVVVNPPRAFPEPLDALPMPDFSLFDLKQHRVPYEAQHPSGIIISSRGCPFECTFCSRNYPYYRARSAQSVVAEMEALRDLGYRSVTFYDEMFNLSRRRVFEICRLLKEKRLGLSWSFRGRVDRLDEELARAMAEVGCVRAHFGVESGTQEMLDRTCKRTRLDQIRATFAICKKFNIGTVAFFILGLPGETREQARRTVDFALELDPEFALFTSLMPQPGSTIYREAVAAGAFPDYFLDYAREPTPDFAFRTWETGMREREVFELMLSGLARFYFRPSYVLGRLRRVGGWGDLRMKAATGVTLAARMGLAWLGLGAGQNGQAPPP